MSREDILLDENSVITEETDSTGTTSENSSTGGSDDTLSVERARTIREINTFLINSYKRKFDRLFTDMREKFAVYSPERQARLYRQISASVGERLAFIRASGSISDNRREVLSHIFVYIQYRVDRAAEEAEQMAGER